MISVKLKQRIYNSQILASCTVHPNAEVLVIQSEYEVERSSGPFGSTHSAVLLKIIKIIYNSRTVDLMLRL